MQTTSLNPARQKAPRSSAPPAPKPSSLLRSGSDPPTTRVRNRSRINIIRRHLRLNHRHTARRLHSHSCSRSPGRTNVHQAYRTRLLRLGCRNRLRSGTPPLLPLSRRGSLPALHKQECQNQGHGHHCDYSQQNRDCGRLDSLTPAHPHRARCHPFISITALNRTAYTTTCRLRIK